MPTGTVTRNARGVQNSFPNFWGTVDGSLSDSGSPTLTGGGSASASVSLNVPLLLVAGVLLFLLW